MSARLQRFHGVDEVEGQAAAMEDSKGSDWCHEEDPSSVQGGGQLVLSFDGNGARLLSRSQVFRRRKA